MSDNTEKQMVREFMLNIVCQIGFLDLGVMQEIHNEASDSQSHFDTIGFVIEPTSYQKWLWGGDRERADVQNKIVEHLIAIRQLMEEHDKHAAQGQKYDEMWGRRDDK